ncbi:protein-serine O-palmitoleoyltransferase por [Lycorma delicatula]|uniref:protein-serine O-palmitoleoyltransferase por n=1 Tax=Lycorma delicatula TaxID=130591 RepID=UPI003F5125C8
MYHDIEDYDILDDIIPDALEDDESSMSFMHLFEYCILPSLQDASSHVSRLFFCCIIFRIVAQHCDISLVCKHVLSAVLGIYVMYYYFYEWVIHIILMVLGFYTLLLLIPKSKGILILLLIFIFLVGNELIIKSESWNKIRGAEMLVGMKLVSVAFDIEPSTRVNTRRMRNKMPSFIEFMGYMFCVGTCIFGPWISYVEYIGLFNKNDTNMKSLSKILRSFFWSVFFFVSSMCLVEWIIPDNSYSWFLVYRDALLFRCGHYFVSFLSDTSISLAGYSSMDPVCQPYHIEFPRSLKQVVVHWNVSMHKWLKYYVFRTTIEFGGFAAVFITYIVSALMHGLNYRLAGVLISLGFYTYVEYSVRMKLANKLDACITARSCPTPCHIHKHTEHMMFVTVFNFLCSLIAVFHLAYLGVIIDTSNSEPVSFFVAFDKWQQLNFISHWFALLTFVFYLVIN